MSRLPLAQQQTDRDHERRSEPGLVHALFGDDATRVLVLSGGKALMRREGDGPKLELLVATSARAAILAPAIGDAVYLGRTLSGDADLPSGSSVLSVSIDAELAASLEPDARLWAGLMETAAHLGALHCGLFTEALAITNWHDTHGFSPRTGSATSPGLAGWVRQAEGETHVSFPRTDAAIIAAVLDRDDRILLGANVRWNPRRFSLLAGFVEPGESFEAAVEREIYEEARARIVEPKYLGSQPWPFPASIMVGFTAKLHPDQDPASVEPDNDEIVELGWFTRDEVRAIEDRLPGPTSIARAIIDAWLSGQLD
ncbi:NAD(+) diphosphatase [Pseudoclavibacter helvolus]|uniref:NAD(+) diphosphatase n=1 Tax=Pseudoclavibacter helvolus TaxID=255205 RepID=UPI003C7344D5